MSLPSSASSWCPGALEGSIVAWGTCTGNAAQDIGPAVAGCTVRYASVPLAASQLPVGASTVPASALIVSALSPAAGVSAIGAITAVTAAAGSWVNVAGLTAAATYSWMLIA